MYNKNLHIILIILVLLGALNYGFKVFNYDFMEYIKNVHMRQFIYVIISLSALLLAFQRDTYLPQFGPSMIPSNAFKEYHNFDTQSIKILANGGIKIVYWANNSINSDNGFNNYENSGIVPVDDDNTATLYFKCPENTLPKHIYYRIIYQNGTISNVITLNIDC
jgi:uncharacterized membrane protein YuzA (DUF378 family)